jgi:hypothetical protein
MTDDVRLDRDAVARILRRADALDTHDDDDDDRSGVGEAALIAAVEEVGMSIEAVRRSIAIDRLGPLPATHFGDRLLGPWMVAVDDEIPGSPREVLARFDAWLVAGHHLRRDFMRELDGEWSRRSDLVGVTIRAIRSATGEGGLGDVIHITVTVRDTGVGTCAVRVTVDRVLDRRLWGGAGSAVAVGGTATVVVALTVVASPLILLAAPIAVGAGAVVAARGRQRAKRTTREIDRLLASVHEQSDPTRLRTDVTRRVVGRSRR